VALALLSLSQACWAKGDPILSDGHQWSFAVETTNGQLYVSAETTTPSNAPTKEMAIRAAELYRQRTYPSCRFEYEEYGLGPTDIPGWDFAIKCPSDR
jgi:hypothetical protein